MSDKDTVNLLRQCSSGAKMALDTVNDLLDYAKTPSFKSILQKSIVDHEKLSHEISKELFSENSAGNEPGKLPKLMAKGTIAAKMLINGSESNAAHIIVDGCTMGIKQSLSPGWSGRYRHACRFAPAYGRRIRVR